MVPPSAPNMRSAPLHFGMELSPAQHELLLGKVIAIFEGDSLQKRMAKITVLGCLSSMVLSSSQKWMFLGTLFSWFDIPAFETANYVLDLSNYLIVSSCHHSFFDKSQDETGYRMVKEAMLTGDALDSQFCACLKSFPVEFGLSMLPDVKSLQSDEIEGKEEEETAIEKAEKQERTLNFK